ncbi:MAG TPA: VWA domain-containing protein [Bryobacteraceae bacterium]|jgi:VWFA-related protein|nr:VWA domain-containing protein [Bryobacteraceae bacterium]
MHRVVCTLALAASALLAQAPSGPLVRLHPVVLDEKGQPVTDLTADDFKITDLSKPETVFAFHKPGHEAPPKGDVLEFSNRSSGSTPYTLAILFDMINLSDSDRLENWHTLDKMLPQLESGANLYLYVLNLEGTLIPIHPMGPASPKDNDWPKSIASAFDKVMKQSSHGRPVQVGAEEQEKRTFKALEDIGNSLAMYPGQREILWIANGLTTVNDPKLTPCNGDWVECGLYVPHLAVTLAGDEVAVNPYVLAGNLNADANYNLDQMALLTGGHFYSRQDLKPVIDQIGAAAAGSYTVLYDPGADNWNNKWHHLHVTTERKGAKLQVRERYYAVSSTLSSTERSKNVLAMAFQAPSDLSTIGLRVKITPLEGKPGAHLHIVIDPTDLLLRQQNGKYAGALYCLISDRNDTAPTSQPSVLDLHPELTADQYKGALKDGLPLDQDHPTDATHLRVILLDQNTDEVGSVTFPIK